jgi:hypothetical protein
MMETGKEGRTSSKISRQREGSSSGWVDLDRRFPRRVVISFRDDDLVNFLFGQSPRSGRFSAHMGHPVMIRTILCGLS